MKLQGGGRISGAMAALVMVGAIALGSTVLGCTRGAPHSDAQVPRPLQAESRAPDSSSFDVAAGPSRRTLDELDADTEDTRSTEGSSEAATTSAEDSTAPGNSVTDRKPDVPEAGTTEGGSGSAAALGRYEIPADASVDQIAALLVDRYDRVVTALAIDPVGASDRRHAARSALDSLVDHESELYSWMLEAYVAKPAAEGTRLIPGADGFSYRHHVLRTASGGDSMFEFLWCGYSPGVRVDATTGAVIDDAVANQQGFGRAIKKRGSVGPRWVLEELGQFEGYDMPPGSPDPCL